MNRSLAKKNPMNQTLGISITPTIEQEVEQRHVRAREEDEVRAGDRRTPRRWRR